MIIITAPAHPVLMDTLTAKGFAILYEPAISYAELSEKIGEATGLVVTTRLSIDKNLIDRAVNLQWIGRLGSGLELIDTVYAKQKNIRCFSTPEGNCNAVAEHALGMILGLMNHIYNSRKTLNENRWKRDVYRGTELRGKTVGIIGYGHTGKAFANLLSCFGVTIMAYDNAISGFGGTAVREASLEQIAQYADIISFHVPLNDSSFHMANKEFFDSVATAPYIINTSRGQVIETGALIDALKTNTIRGAALDVLENELPEKMNAEEKSQFEWLQKQENVILTPHIAGYSHEAYQLMSIQLLKKLNLTPVNQS